MDRPELLLIEPPLSVPEALIFIDSSLSCQLHYPIHSSAWWSVLRQVGWRGSIYYLAWDRSPYSLLEYLAQMGPESIGYWQRYKSRAKRVGKSRLPLLISDLPEQKFSLFSLSLGARVAYYTMQDWLKTSACLNNALFLAGAVLRGSSKDWEGAARSLQGRLINVYNVEDWVLKRFCQMLDWERSPCGIKPIKLTHDHIYNVNATPLMKTAKHEPAYYLPVLQTLVEREIWKL
ncbi:MAG: DUF726 domain-containing protein [Spirulinaceae cyanobacterium SM2_1_0]|nr:DUF726 domain-containing protein [Spirulinaceae cyanobacterium SM2_1_0]